MSSASNGRKNRPRSSGNIFQIGKPPYREPQRRESTESTRKAQRAVADCRMVGLRHASARLHGASVFCVIPLKKKKLPLFQDHSLPSRACTMHARQLLIGAE